MKVLGIDTSSLATSVAVIEDNKLICEYTINTKKTHSQNTNNVCLKSRLPLS